MKNLNSMKIQTEQRVGVFVDVQNLYYSAKNLYNSKVNYAEILKAAVGSRTLVRAFAYVVKADVDTESTFFDALFNMGFEVRVKELQVFEKVIPTYQSDKLVLPLPNLVLRVIRPRQCVHERIIRHGAIERSIEHRDLRDREQLHACLNGRDLRRVVQRGELQDLAQLRERSLRDAHRAVKMPAMHYPMPDGIQL